MLDEYIYIVMIMGDCQILEDALRGPSCFKNFIDAKNFLVSECSRCIDFDMTVFDKCVDNTTFNYDDGNLILKLEKKQLL